MSRDKTVIIFAVICALILSGEIIDMLHPSSDYRASASITGDGVFYSVSTGPSAEFRIVVTDNDTTLPIEKVYLYYDPDYGSPVTYVESNINDIEQRLNYCGFPFTETIDTEKLIEIVSGTTAGIGIVMASGAIPEEVAFGPLLNWIQNGGTLYWTRGTIGSACSKSDGTFYYLEQSKEIDYLSAYCTYEVDTYATSFMDDGGYSDALQFENDYLAGALDSSRITFEKKCYGYTDGTLSEVTFVKCGNGTICIISGCSDDYQKNDIAKTICSGLSIESTLAGTDKCILSVGSRSTGTIEFIPASAHNYTILIYTSGINTSYAKITRGVAP